MNETGQTTAAFLRARRTRLGFRKLGPATGAIWTLCGNIYLNSRLYPPDQTPATHPWLLSLIVHEAVHLRQGWLTALSVYGELEAWQAGIAFYCEAAGRPPQGRLAEILALPLGWDRQVLRRARELMQRYAGRKYRADLLPLYPIHYETRYWLTRQSPQLR
ncbi:MAG: hypothetical protein ABWK53_10165 [Anaerolineales bacterium]